MSSSLTMLKFCASMQYRVVKSCSCTVCLPGMLHHAACAGCAYASVSVVKAVPLTRPCDTDLMRPALSARMCLQAVWGPDCGSTVTSSVAAASMSSAAGSPRAGQQMRQCRCACDRSGRPVHWSPGRSCRTSHRRQVRAPASERELPPVQPMWPIVLQHLAFMADGACLPVKD